MQLEKAEKPRYAEFRAEDGTSLADEAQNYICSEEIVEIHPRETFWDAAMNCSSGSILPSVSFPAASLDQRILRGLSRSEVSRNGVGLRSRRRSFSVSATMESLPDTSVENGEVQISLPTESLSSSSTIPKMRKPKSMPDLQAVDYLRVQIKGRRSGADPWFPKSQEHSESSKKFRDSIMKNTIQRLKSEVDKSNRKVEESSTLGQFPDNNRRPVSGLG
ncbi:hypothetical protein R1sor_024983 [Riccia sorocarpa]|uniref:Uncharacterized protein n=1 Tax=Riccia sorocarpa TaxID=122646 RepID=A0ABD3GAE2_9MARC